jgi:soluble lytic murein transglycosylase-like protein
MPGIRHLKYLLARHDGNLVLALAAYYAGEGAVAKHAGRIPPYRESDVVCVGSARAHALA